ncbi:MAG: hypothetical protein WD894_05110 [Pirellulales bacterium]
MIVFHRIVSCLVAVAACWALPAAISAAEPVEKFLAALRRNGYHDMAVEYLARVVSSSHVDDDFKRRYPYELGSVLLDSARAAGDPAVRDQLAEQGIGKLKEFVASNAADPLVGDAQAKLADTLLERGRALVARADRSRDREQILRTARALLVEATKTYEAVEKHHLAAFEKQSPTADREKRNELGGPILGARLRIAQALSDVAKTYDAGAPQATQALQQGINRYAELYKKYENDGFVAAYAARVHEAANYLELGEPDEALSRLANVLSLQLKDESLRDTVFTPAHLVALKAWHKKGDFKTALEKAETYVANPSSSESKRPDWLEMQYLLALAYQQQAQTLRSGDAQRTKLETEARKLAGQVVKYRSEVQDDTRLLLGKLGRPVDAEIGDVKTFAEALDKATTAIQDYTAVKLAYDTARQTADVNQAERARLGQQLIDTRESAYRLVRRTVSLADEKSDLTQLNTARFYVCFLHWEYAQAESAENKVSSNYFDAAVLGDFLARRFPDHAHARQAMAIAMASYQKIRQDVVEESQQAAEKAGLRADEIRTAVDAAVAGWSDKLSQLAEYAVAKWPAAEEAADAVAVLAAVAVERQDFDAARSFVEKLKPGSARRADVELRLGRAIWAHYVRAKKALDEAQQHAEQNGDLQNSSTKSQGAAIARSGYGQPDAKAANQQALAQSASQAQALLESGLKAAGASEEIDRGAVLGLWALVQSYVTTSQPEKAIPWLEDEKLGLLTLVNDKHEAAEIEGLMFDAYRLALRAYIAVKPQQLDKALSTMDALEKITGNDAKGREMLTTVYIAMGRDLQDEIKRLLALGDVSEVAALSTAFETFLERLAGRDSGNTFSSLFWVADTYSELGAGLDQAAAESADNRKPSRDYYRQAVTAFEEILKRDRANADFMPDKYLPLVQLRLAKAYRGAGDYTKALTLLASILKEKPNVLDVQFDAAYTYQELAESDPGKFSKYFRQAILGGEQDDTRSIWGWNSLAQKIRTQHERLRRDADDPTSAERAEQYRQRYQEARYNSVYCTFALAKSVTNPSEKARLLKTAKQGIWSVFAIVDSQLGGGQWKTKNDQLLKDIQSALGEPAMGLLEFEQRKQQQAQSVGK